ncbi:amidohydrolase [Natranaerofaba carboxydovora]|uniref:amidohydrolase n=1 Tax=Natranaerofaba carboxydovora TaxID=2742683 RepID=UPI001F140797|nr:amidohydrolase [Natranaerofaba carboxydovora]UMZ72631.1 5-methylthioadenosine/S-adenosylhomocysteine deaminase [Natranaerofaba carboxydovora]
MVQNNKVLIKDCFLVPMTNKPEDNKDDNFYKGSIAIEDGKIFAISPPGNIPEYWTPDEVIDGKNKVVMPGFVNCHTHAAMTLLRSYADDLPLMKWLEEKIWPLESKLDENDIYWGTILAISEMLLSGTTTFADMYDKMDGVALAVKETGIRASLSRGMIGLQDNAVDALKENEELFKNWNNTSDGRINIMYGPHAPYTCPPEFLEKVIESAKNVGASIHIHLAETLDELNQIQEQYEKRPVEHVNDLGLFEVPVLAAHCVHVNDEEMDILKANNVGVAHNPESNMKLGSGIAPIPKMLDKKLKLGIGTDGASSNNNLDMLEETRSAALLQKVQTLDPTVMPAYQTLYMATRGGAEVLGLADQIGSLEEGKCADLIMLDLNKPHLAPTHDVIANIVYSARADDITMVMVNGQKLVQDKELQLMDVKSILDEIDTKITNLLNK